VKDATASFLWEEMHAALEVNLPNYVNAVATTYKIGGFQAIMGTRLDTVFETE
jgi:hypothetical protein